MLGKIANSITGATICALGVSSLGKYVNDRSNTDHKAQRVANKALNPNEGDWLYNGHSKDGAEGIKDLGQYA